MTKCNANGAAFLRDAFKINKTVKTLYLGIFSNSAKI